MEPMRTIFYAKENICRYQKANDVFICDMLHADDVTPLAPKLITISSDNREAALFCERRGHPLRRA